MFNHIPLPIISTSLAFVALALSIFLTAKSARLRWTPTMETEHA
jgi:hypothetical protein